MLDSQEQAHKDDPERRAQREMHKLWRDDPKFGGAKAVLTCKEIINLVYAYEQKRDANGRPLDFERTRPQFIDLLEDRCHHKHNCRASSDRQVHRSSGRRRAENDTRRARPPRRVWPVAQLACPSATLGSSNNTPDRVGGGARCLREGPQAQGKSSLRRLFGQRLTRLGRGSHFMTRPGKPGRSR